jgi:hypothetical protein
MQATVIQSDENVNVRNIVQDQALHRKYKFQALWRLQLMKCLGCCYILGHYTISGQNLLYKIWVDWPAVSTDTLYLKYRKTKKKKKNEKIKTKIFIKTTQNVHMYILLDTDKDFDLLHDRTILSTGRLPHNKQNCNCLDYNQNLVMIPGGAQH